MNNITKAQMLEYFSQLQAYHFTENTMTVGCPSGPIADAIRSLISAMPMLPEGDESSGESAKPNIPKGEKESGEAQTEDERRVDADKALWPAPSPGPSAEGVINLARAIHDMGGEVTITKDGNSAIEGYPASAKRALTVPSPLPEAVEKAMDEVESVIALAGGLTKQGREEAFAAFAVLRASLTKP
jgi:hypothetical protein